MSLTGKQKHYIKRNAKRLGTEKIAYDLDLSEKDVKDYLKKHWGKAKFGQLIGNQGSLVSRKTQTGAKEEKKFDLTEFIADNINYFILLFILVFIVYFNSLNNGFVSDDIDSVKNNSIFQSFKNINNLWTLGFIPHFIAYKISSASPWAYRIFNILFHIGSTFSIFILVNLISKKRVLSLCAASLFAVHPILTETISWISARPYGQYSLFFLLSFIFYIISSNSRNKAYFISLFLFIISLISSEKSVVLFLILFLFELSFGNLRNNWKKLAPFVAFSLLFAFMYLAGIGKRIDTLSSTYYANPEGLNNPLIQVPTAISIYLGLIFWPDKLSLYQTEMNFSMFQYIVFVLIFLTLFGLIVYGWKRNRQLFFWPSFFIIALLPTLSPLKISWIVAERYVYLGTIGIFVVFAIFFDWLVKKAEKENEQYKYALYGVFMVIIVALSVRTIVRNIDWKNEDNLWIATGKTAPSGFTTHNNLGDVYGRQGNLEKAAEEFKKAIELNPNYADAYHNLGNTYINMNKKQEALEVFKKAVEINPNLWQSYQNMAVIYFDQGDFQKSYEMIKKALEINSNDQILQENTKIIELKINSAK